MLPSMLPLQDEEREIISLIESYPFTADFCEWITNGESIYTILHEHLGEGQYTRVIQYSRGDSIFFKGNGILYTDKLKKETIKALIQNRSPLRAQGLPSCPLKKQVISKIIAAPYYHRISQLYNKNELIGTLWEAYDLPCLVKYYRQKFSS